MSGVQLVDLSHTVEHGMVTYKGLPAPLICDFLTREASRAFYAPGTEFHIGESGPSWCGTPGRAITAAAFDGLDVRGKAVLVSTGWDRHWRTDAYFEGHPFLTAGAARCLAERGAALVGIDSYNIDDTADGSRPAHTILLGAQIPICEHMCNLGALSGAGFRFFAVPVKVAGFGTFPVRALAVVEEACSGEP
jgi:arylformamidase